MKDKDIIEPWDETWLNENSVNVRCGNDVFSIFLKISEDATQHDETYKIAASMLETMP